MHTYMIKGKLILYFASVKLEHMRLNFFKMPLFCCFIHPQLWWVDADQQLNTQSISFSGTDKRFMCYQHCFSHKC